MSPDGESRPGVSPEERRRQRLATPILTALLIESRMFLTCSIQWPASRFICGHLRRDCSRACTSRISAQDPGVTPGKAGNKEFSSTKTPYAHPISSARPGNIDTWSMQADSARLMYMVFAQPGTVNGS